MRSRAPRNALLALAPAALLGSLLLGMGSAHSGAVSTPHGTAPLAAAVDVTPGSTSAWPNDGARDTPVASGGCGQAPPVAPGTTERQTVAVNPATDEGYTTRTYWVHVPRGYDASRPAMLVLVFHGGGGTGISMEASTGLSALADQKGFLVVYPQGLPFATIGPGYTTWAATGPLDSVGNGVDDLLFVSVLLDQLQRQYCVDPARIDATGFSAGGAMTAFLTCGLTGRIGAFAPMSGDFYQFLGGCFPHHPTSILEFHGAADPAEVYTGFPAREDPDWRRTGVMEWLSGWAARDGCAAGPTVFLNAPPVRGEQWTGCHGGTTVAHYLVAGLGHSWPPPIQGQSAAELMWAFFQAHPLQQG